MMMMKGCFGVCVLFLGIKTCQDLPEGLWDEGNMNVHLMHAPGRGGIETDPNVGRIFGHR